MGEERFECPVVDMRCKCLYRVFSHAACHLILHLNTMQHIYTIIPRKIKF